MGWNYSEWIAEDRRRARVVFTALAGGVALGASIAAIVLASEGSALRWLIAIAGFVAGVLVLVGIRSATTRQASVSPKWNFVGYAVVIGVGPFAQHARATIQIGALATTAGYLAALVLLAWAGASRKALK